MFYKKVIFISGLILLSLFLYNQNNDIVINYIDYYNHKLPSNFKNYTILQVSDLHNKRFGKNQIDLINYTKEINPDIIVITGDAIDRRRTNVDNMNIALSYLKEAVKIAPVYFVTGNHEISAEEVYPKFKEEIEKIGVINLNDRNIKITKEDQRISLIGVNNISSIKYMSKQDKLHTFEKKIRELKNNNFSILLSHRPDLIELYERAKIDLVLCGHAHGGQIRLPYIGGLFAPDQGVLPHYTSGMYTEKTTSMIVSRGLGNSRFPFRIFNKPELVVINFKKKYKLGEKLFLKILNEYF